MEITEQAQVDRPTCLQATLRIMGDKWTALILEALKDGPLTFSALEKTLINISPRTLSQRLEMLTTEEILEKRQYCEHPPRSNYSLTRKGVELKEIISKMADWGAKYPAIQSCDTEDLS